MQHIVLKYCLRARYIIAFYALLALTGNLYQNVNAQTQPDSSREIPLPFPFQDDYNPEYNTDEPKPNLFLNDPNNAKPGLEYDTETGQYKFTQKFDDGSDYRPPTYMEIEEFQEFQKEQGVKEYWKEKTATEEEFNQPKASPFRPQIKVESEAFDRIFGGNTIDIRPAGSAELIFGVNSNRTENPAIPERQRRNTNFNFDQRIQLNIIGNIGDKMKITTNYNTQAIFEFENQMKLDYTGYDDEILQKIEMGNVALPLNSQLITGSQSLFGLKTELKFGRLTVTSVFSQQRGQRKEITTEGGAQVREFDIPADMYEFNRHFFLSHYFRDQYEEALSIPPLLNTGANITKIEVWVTNTRNVVDDTRNIIAFQDLGEGNPERFFNTNYVQDLSPQNFAGRDVLGEGYKANNLYDKLIALPGVRNFVQVTNVLNAQQLAPGSDYQKVELARRLNETEFTFHPQLGYISLNTQLNPNQVLAVSFQYTFRGQTYQVGEFSTDGIDGTQPLIVKMLKSTELNTKIPMWDLMMKNVYSMGAFNVKRDNFLLHVWYLDQNTGLNINYIPAGAINDMPLIQPLGLDKLTVNMQPNPDGVFDFIDNPQMTINPSTGRVFFPVLEPFGKTLRDAIGNEELADIYAFDSLYTKTQADARVLFPEKNRFSIRGHYESSNSSEIMLDAINVPEGSVTVTAGGRQLIENQDYTVDYTLGRVSIINQGVMESGTPIKVSMESNQLFNIQQKTMVASRFDYKFSDDLRVGGTIMNLSERPLTQKINVGNEPIRNTIWGVDANYQTESRFLTTMIDKIPLINTKEKSTITMSGEFAQLLPGHSRAIGQDGNSYIDDFEGSQSFIDIRQMQNWSIASTPQFQPQNWPEARYTGDLRFGMNRAKIAWYTVDPLFYRTVNASLMPDHILEDVEMRSNHFMREVFESEVFPNRDIPVGQPSNIPLLDVAYYPDERGPYNYDAIGTDVSAGLNNRGRLNNPSSRWGGIMRKIDQNDFEAANIEYIQFWLMDPFNEDYPHNPNNNGFLYFHLGNISEDVLNDGLKSFENGLPTTAAASTNLDADTISPWGRVSLSQQLVQAFDNDVTTREFQDVGLDGLRDQEERVFFNDYVQAVQGIVNQPFLDSIIDDPSADNFTYYRDDRYDNNEFSVSKRYKRFNGLEGNSATNEQSQLLNAAGYPTTASPRPNAEDINMDNTLDDIEGYFQYRIPISRATFDPSQVGNNFITDVLETRVNTQNGEQRTIRWYQVKIPVRTDLRDRYGNITDFRSIRFMRMALKGFEEPIYLRFARLELIRGEWRRYTGRLDDRNEGLAEDGTSSFNIAAVNIEENGSRTPVNYVIPPDIQREVNLNTTNLQRLNEQSLALQVCDLNDGLAHAAFRNMDLDFLNFERLKMYVHAEAAGTESVLNDNDLTVFIRLGTDFEDNYYEYEIPVLVTPPGYYNPDSEQQQEQVWPIANNIEIDFDELRRAKIERNREMLTGLGTTVQQRRSYKSTDGRANIYVIGNPNLSTVKTIMIGVRNPARTPNNPNDDGMPKCAEIWVNELRLTNFDSKAGWAATGRITAKLADLGNVTLSGAMSTPGFGSIEKRVSERQRETIQQVDATASIELGKFLPEKSGIKVPMYVSYGENIVRPQFSPLDTDIPFDEYNELITNQAEVRDSIRRVTESRTIRKSINFTNVRKEKSKTDGINTPLDISNFNFSYSYSEIYMRSFNVERDIRKNYRAAIGYNYTLKPKNIEPFSSVSFLKKSKYLALIKDFNFYLLPRQITFRNDFDRIYNEQQNRNANPGITANMPPFFNKTFNWNRTFTWQQDITKALKFDFSSGSTALVTEPDGLVDKNRDPEGYEVWRDSVWSSITDFGEIMNYRHMANLNYTLPFKKIPILDWINSTARYSATFNWQRAPFAAPNLGGVIQNTRQMSLNNTLNMTGLYNKSKWLKSIDQKARRRQRFDQKDQKAARNVRQEESGEKEKDPNRLTVFEQSARIFTSLKNVSVTYAQNEGLLIPGYEPTPFMGGMDRSFTAPGLGFLVGQQNGFDGVDSLRYVHYAAQNNWLVKEENLNTNVAETFQTNLNLRASLQPINDLRIELTATQQRMMNATYFYRWSPDTAANDNDIGRFVEESYLDNGSYSVSFSSWRTAFESRGDDYSSATFDRFLELRSFYSEELASDNPNSVGVHTRDSVAGFADGYGSTSPDVLIPAFLAAYSNTPAGMQTKNPLAVLPRMNWRITYTGLSKVPALAEYFESVTVNHSYRSTLNFGNYTTNLLYQTDQGGNQSSRDQVQNFIPQYQYNNITISEQFAPLINFDVKWKNSLQTRVEFKRDRTLSLNFANTQITEIIGNEFLIGAGYRFKDVVLPIEISPGKKLKSDLNVRADFSVRRNATIIRKMVEEINQPTAGQDVFSIKINADYTVSQRLVVRAFFDRVINTPLISIAFPTSNTMAGISLRFTLS